MVDEITTALSRFNLCSWSRAIRVLLTRASRRHKAVGRELGVRYVLEGSVRKAAGKLYHRPLIDAATGSTFGDQFEGDWRHLRSAGPNTESVVSVIAPRCFKLKSVWRASTKRPQCLRLVFEPCRISPHGPGRTAEPFRVALAHWRLTSVCFAARLAGSCHLVSASGMDGRSEVGHCRRVEAYPVGTQYRWKRRYCIEHTRWATVPSLTITIRQGRWRTVRSL